MSANAFTALERCGAFRVTATASPKLRVTDDAGFADGVGTAVGDNVGFASAHAGVHRFVVHLDASVLIAGTLEYTALLNAYMAQTTTVPRGLLVRLPHQARIAPGFASANTTLAQAAVQEIKALSNLTNELVAPLLGVSRRSLQAWVAGKAISHPKEQRLLKLRDALRELDTGDPQATYRRLMDQAPGRVRVYDLLASGRFETAVDVAIRRRRVEPPQPAKSKRESLAVQLSRLEDQVDVVETPSTGRFSGRARR